MILLKKSIALVISLLMFTTLLAGCDEQTEIQNPKNTVIPVNEEKEDNTQKLEKSTEIIRFRHFNGDEAKLLKEAFEAVYPNVTVELQVVEDTNGYSDFFPSILRYDECPDVYATEVAFVKRFVNISEAYEDLSAAPYNAEELKNQIAPYTIDIGRSDDGKIRALSHQAAAGAVGYKRDIAKKYLGTDDSAEIGEMFSSAENIIETAKKLQKESGGKVKLFPNVEELMRMYLGAREQAWVEGNKLTIDPKIQEYVNVAKELRDIGAEGGMEPWSAKWANSIQDDIHFAYAIPTWGLSWIIDVNQEEDEKKTGNWGLAKPPVPYTWGGTWFGIYKGSQNKELAWEFIKFITLNEEQAISWAKSSGDFVSNLAAIKKLSKDETVINETINQNPYEFFEPMIGSINGAIMTKYDDQITNLFTEEMHKYLDGNISEEQMWTQFKDNVRSDLGYKIEVE